MRKLTQKLVRTALLLGGLVVSGPVLAAGDTVHLIEKSWPQDGIFGSYDRAALQRGLQVFQNVCSACHGLKYVAFRDLGALGYDEDELKAFAANFTVTDGPDDMGDMFERDARPSDRWPSPYPNDKAAAAANGGQAPPDLSLITKAREDGTNYIYSLMVGYEEPPADFALPDGASYNKYFPGHAIAMPEPLFEDAVEYADGTPATVDQMASDVAQFLAWAAEPKLEARKRTGIKVTLFLLVMAGIFYGYKRRVWAALH